MTSVFILSQIDQSQAVYCSRSGRVCARPRQFEVEQTGLTKKLINIQPGYCIICRKGGSRERDMIFLSI